MFVVLLLKMVFNTYKRQRILHYYFQGYKAPAIARLLRESLPASRWRVDKFLKKYQETGSVVRHPGSGRPSKITREVKRLVEQQMHLNDKTTAYQLHELLKTHGTSISLRTVLRCRTSLRWTFRDSAYCQLIRRTNKEKRLVWARENVDLDFKRVVGTDECTVQLQSHRRFCCRKRGEPPKNKPRYAQGLTSEIIYMCMYL